MSTGHAIRSNVTPAAHAAGDALDDHAIQQLGGGWIEAGELGYDFRPLTVEQVRRIAPFVVEAVWRRGLGPLLLIHGGDRALARALGAQWRAGDWIAWSYWYQSKRHRSMPTRLLLALRPDPQRPRTPLPDLEPGEPQFDEPRCVGLTTAGDECLAVAAAKRPYCAQHDPLTTGNR